MVVANRESIASLIMHSAKKAAFYHLRQNNFLMEPIILFSMPIPTIPRKCWVVRMKKSESFLSVLAGKNEALLVFSTRMKAIECLKNIGENPSRYSIIPFAWDEMVKNFEDDYSFVIIDELGLHESVIIVAIGFP